jgi:valyl-tRNA synthetase
MKELEKTYDPKAVEPKWYGRALEAGHYHGEAARGGDPYCIVIPPPNVTGILHMGHALNNTLQDILVRWRRMEGRNVVWMPGTDHAGIATQNVVERALKKEGISRQQLGREAFVERVWTWKEEYGGTIISQLKSLGSACDWQRERFTMDPGLSRAVTEVFVRLYDKGLIYRGTRIINWCPRCHTALSDEESEHRDTDGKLYYIRYRLEKPEGGREYVVVATTRPETLLGDSAVAVNPDDDRYAGLVGKRLILPVLGRAIPVIADAFVDPKFGTGAVKVTPAHDPNDYDMGMRHDLPQINVMHGDGRMNEAAGPYAGLDRFECRKKILEDLEAAGLIETIEPHKNAVGHCYRCDTVVEPRLSPQWFVKMKPLAGPAIEAVRDGRIRFMPDRWTKVYLEWMENIRDWCISRQIWWGHRIPVYTCEGCQKEWAAVEKPACCPVCKGTSLKQDEDVLDTWFSSWLWPFSTFGWPDKNPDLALYYPTHTLVTASEIIFFWVARMIMAGFEFMGDIPFREVYIHGTVRDDKGRKMSKSLGNSLDPREIINETSADALRFSLMMLTATGQDVFVNKEKLEIGRNFGTKIWNAARFMQMHGKTLAPDALDPVLDPALLSDDDRQILFRLQETIASCTSNLEKYRFNDAAHDLYEFVWHQFCDWYLESSKEVLFGADEARKAQVVKIMQYCLGTSLRLLHPFMPFLTEELWHAFDFGGEADTILFAAWPKPLAAAGLAPWGADAETAAYVDEKHELIRAGRMLRADTSIAPGVKVDYVIKPADAATAARLLRDAPGTAVLLKAREVKIDPAFAPAKAMPSAVTRVGTIYMPVEGLVDVPMELARLNKELDKVTQEAARVDKKLGNPDFMAKAAESVVEQQRALQLELAEKAARLKHLMEMLNVI